MPDVGLDHVDVGKSELDHDLMEEMGLAFAAFDQRHGRLGPRNGERHAGKARARADIRETAAPPGEQA